MPPAALAAHAPAASTRIPVVEERIGRHAAGPAQPARPRAGAQALPRHGRQSRHHQRGTGKPGGGPARPSCSWLRPAQKQVA
jgi:hypothetical protein